MSGKYSLVDGEKICELVHSYLTIYDKSQKGNKERDTVANGKKYFDL